MLKFIKNLPEDLKYKIMEFYPIITYEKYKLNQSIRTIYLIQKIKIAYKSYFSVDILTNDNDYTDIISSEYLISDMYLYFKTTILNNKININKYKELLDNSELFLNIYDFADLMTEFDVKSFWRYCNKIYNMDKFININL